MGYTVYFELAEKTLKIVVFSINNRDFQIQRPVNTPSKRRIRRKFWIRKYIPFEKVFF